MWAFWRKYHGSLYRFIHKKHQSSPVFCVWKQVCKGFQYFRILHLGSKGIDPQHRPCIIFISKVTHLLKLVLVGSDSLFGKTFGHYQPDYYKYGDAKQNK